MQTLFISDLHLDPIRPQKIDLFIAFTEALSANVNSLFILGDVFEFWNGDDDNDEQYKKVMDAIAELSKRNINIYIMRGNRDFLFGKQFEQKTHSILLNDPSVIELNGKNILLMHGDLLCTDDTAYQILRKITNNTLFKKLFSSLPLSWRKSIASQGRKISRSQNQKKSSEIMDVNQSTVENYMKQYSVNELIHGHTHRQAIHHFQLDGKPATRYVLGDWYDSDSVLVYESDRQEFLRIKDYIRTQR